MTLIRRSSGRGGGAEGVAWRAVCPVSQLTQALALLCGGSTRRTLARHQQGATIASCLAHDVALAGVGCGLVSPACDLTFMQRLFQRHRQGLASELIAVSLLAAAQPVRCSMWHVR